MKQGIFRHSPMLLVVLLLAACAGHAQQHPAATPTNPAKASQTMNTTCKNLAPVNNIDDLLYQMHSNLDSHCLFETPTAELERIWGIRVFDLSLYETSTDEAAKDRLNAERMRYYDEENTFFVEKFPADDNEPANFKVVMTHAYGKAHPDLAGKFPARLPQPVVYRDVSLAFAISPSVKRLGHPEPFVPPGTQYTPHTYYLWFNPNKNTALPYMSMRTGIYPISDSIFVYRNTRNSPVRP